MQYIHELYEQHNEVASLFQYFLSTYIENTSIPIRFIHSSVSSSPKLMMSEPRAVNMESNGVARSLDSFSSHILSTLKIYIYSLGM